MWGDKHSADDVCDFVLAKEGAINVLFEISKTVSQKLAKGIKDHLGLVTVLGALIGLILAGYEWKEYIDVSRQVAYNNEVGLSLLEQGRYERAKRSFEKALLLGGSNRLALQASVLCDLFIDMSSPDWDPAMGWIVRPKLNQLQLEVELQHIASKYWGDLYLKISDEKAAKSQYAKAIDQYTKSHNAETGYLDALYYDGWLSYQQKKGPDIERMISRFKNMTRSAPFDYRGFHGLGYAYYMKALSEKDPRTHIDLLIEAGKQSIRATKFRIYQLNVIMDFGEVARARFPSYSLDYHTHASKVLSDPILRNIEANKGTFQVRLLKDPDKRIMWLESEQEKRAWIKYQIALDYLALYSLSEQPKEEHWSEHLRFLKEAASEDIDVKALRIYSDQKRVLGELISLKTKP